MRHHFSIVRVIGLILFGFGVFVAGVTVPELVDRITYDGAGTPRSLWYEGILSYFLVGIFLMIVGLVGLLKNRWFPVLGGIGLILAIVMVSWFAFVTVRIQRIRNDDFFLAAGLVILAYSALVSLIFVIQNQYFLEALQDEEGGTLEDDRILDA